MKLEAGSSTAMEALGHKKALTFLLTTRMVITTFVSDRHASIAKCMRETCPKICKDLENQSLSTSLTCGTLGKVCLHQKSKSL